jgi:probable rRNA maturation factor
MTVRLSGPTRRRGLPRVDRRLLRKRAAAVLREIGRPEGELSIHVVDDAEIAALNSEHRGKPTATDVLSFSLMDGDHSDFRGDLLGDVVIGLETAARQAESGARDLDAEIARLLIHGALHLLGWDHVDASEARRMRAEERRILRAIGA